MAKYPFSVASPPFSRRQLFAGGFIGAGGLVAAGCADTSSAPASTTSTQPAQSAFHYDTVDGVKLKVSPWLIQENKKKGSLDWILSGYPPSHGLEGFTSAVSANVDTSVRLMVSTTDVSYKIQAYRMGYYGGYGGRLIATSPTLPGVVQPPPIVDKEHGTVQCQWATSWTANLKGWPPGFYLFKLTSAKNWQQWIPFCIRDDASKAALVIMSASTTYQAYNWWGGWSLYKDESGAASKRASVVSFDRPYPQDWEQGAADFFGNEFPVLYQMEQLGLDMTYWTDIDLDLRGETLPSHKALISLGHDEYWSTPMRQHMDSSLSKGVNFAFLGANMIYRKIRLAPTGYGPARLMTCYKSPDDPLTSTNPSESTVNWRSPPVNLPESLVTGSTYISVNAHDGLVVSDPAGWWWKGTGVKEGQNLPLVVSGEYNRFIPGGPGPQNIQLFGHSPVVAQNAYSDITYMTREKGGGVLSTGSAAFVNFLSNSSTIPKEMVPDPVPGVTPILLRAMVNLYGLFGEGPAGTLMPSQTNWQQYYK